MEVVLKRQFATASYIDRFWENLLKAGKMTPPYLAARLELLESYWARFLSAHDELLSFDKVEVTEYMKLNVFFATEDNYTDAKSRITALMPTKGVETTSDASEAGTVLRQIQLPKINLPTFNGDQLQWEGFRDLFKSLVHDVEGLAPIQKLQYLKANLSGDAAGVIANIEVSAQEYALAWDKLVVRYDNRRVFSSRRICVRYCPRRRCRNSPPRR